MFPFYRHLKKIFDLNPIQHVPYFAKLARGILELRRSCSVGRRDLVQLMLEATEESNNGVKTLTDEEIIGQSITFLVAGGETTGSTLALIAYHLAYYPEIQERLLREIDDATRSRGDVSIYEFVQSLEYLDRVVSEVLRLCTVGYVNVRDCMETCVINGVEFPAGACVYILSYCVHRDPDYWPEVDCLLIIIILICKQECFTGKYTSSKIYTKLHPVFEWHIPYPLPVKIFMTSLISCLTLKLYLIVLVYDRNILGSFLEVFGDLRLSW